jgi:ABC-2 type transport system permease protein
MLLQYRAAALAGVGTQLFFGFVLIMVLEAFYRSSAVEPPIGFSEAVTYVWLGQALFAMQPWNHDLEVEAMVRRGTVAYELLRPVDLYAYWFARTVALRTSRTTLRCLPVVLVAGLVLSRTSLERWALAAPESAASALAFAVALGVALLLGCAITTAVHVSLLWTISGDGVARLMPALVIMFSGMVIPLPLFPDWSQPLLALLPFRGLADTPYRIYSGHIPVDAAWGPIGWSLAWSAALVVAGRAALARGCRRVVVQGG